MDLGQAIVYMQGIEDGFNAVMQVLHDGALSRRPSLGNRLGYDIQQVVEKSLKSILLFTHHVEDDKKFRTHDIVLLLDKMEEFEPGFIASHAELSSMAERLTYWEAGTRYSGDIFVDEAKARKAVPVAKAVMEEAIAKFMKVLDDDEADHSAAKEAFLEEKRKRDALFVQLK